MTRTLLGLALCLAIVGLAGAAPVCTTTQCAPTVTTVLANPGVAAQILVPTYGAQFVPGAAQQAASDELLRELLAEIKAHSPATKG